VIAYRCIKILEIINRKVQIILSFSTIHPDYCDFLNFLPFFSLRFIEPTFIILFCSILPFCDGNDDALYTEQQEIPSKK
jgi:hypothetical protein